VGRQSRRRVPPGEVSGYVVACARSVVTTV
jgi:hypothetical protein